MIRTHNFDFDVRFLPISAHTLKAIAACCQQIQIHQIWRLVLSVISVLDGMNVKHTSLCIFEFYFTRKIIQTIQIVLQRAKFRGKMKNYFVIVFAEIFQFGTTSKSNREAKIIFSSCFSQSLGSCSSCSGFRPCRERERKKMVTSHLFYCEILLIVAG